MSIVDEYERQKKLVANDQRTDALARGRTAMIHVERLEKKVAMLLQQNNDLRQQVEETHLRVERHAEFLNKMKDAK